MADESAPSLENRVARLERDLAHLTTGIGLLGIKPCCWCKNFFRTTEPSTLFDQGTAVCYGCIPEWWHQNCSQVSDKEREITERALKMWLLNYHHAEVIKSPEKLPKDPPPRLQIVVSCFECHTTGNLAVGRCRFCDGRGTVWVVVRG